MNTKTFIEELKEDCKSKKIEEGLLNRLTKKLDCIGEEWANEIVEDIKKGILSKARTGECQTIKGDKTICYTFCPQPFRYNIEKGHVNYVSHKIIKQDKELEKLLLELQERNISTVGFCCYNYETDGDVHCNYLEPSMSWTSKVKRRLSTRQKILGFLTFGIFFLSCLFSDGYYGSWSGARVYIGTIKYDYLFRKCCSLVKQKLKQEKIVVEGFRIECSNYFSDVDSIYDSGYKLLGVFQDINNEIPIKHVDSIAKSHFHRKGKMCNIPTSFSILCKVIVE